MIMIITSISRSIHMHLKSSFTNYRSFVVNMTPLIFSIFGTIPDLLLLNQWSRPHSTHAWSKAARKTVGTYVSVRRKNKVSEIRSYTAPNNRWSAQFNWLINQSRRVLYWCTSSWLESVSDGLRAFLFEREKYRFCSSYFIWYYVAF